LNAGLDQNIASRTRHLCTAIDSLHTHYIPC
jgi:hypothetical protein